MYGDKVVLLLFFFFQAKSEYISSLAQVGVVGWGKDVVYLVSPGQLTDIGLQLGKACYP